MGYKMQAPALAVVVLMIFAAANTHVADAQLPIPGVVNGLVNVVTGNITCPAGNGTGLPIPGVNVFLICPTNLGVNETVGQGRTDANGSFTISLGSIFTILPALLGGTCRAVVNLPLNQTVCPILNTANGTLSSTVTFLSSIIGLLGQIIGKIYVAFRFSFQA